MRERERERERERLRKKRSERERERNRKRQKRTREVEGEIEPFETRKADTVRYISDDHSRLSNPSLTTAPDQGQTPTLSEVSTSPITPAP